MAAKKRRPAKAHKPVRKPAKKASKARKHVKRPAKAKAHRAAGHGETLHKGPNWVTAREVSGRMHVTNSAGEGGLFSGGEGPRREDPLTRKGWKRGRGPPHSSHSTAHRASAHPT